MKILADTELLTKFERENLQAPYREYFTAKRHNFTVNIDAFRALWDCFMLVDKIWICEFEDMAKGTSRSRGFPLFLFVNAHAKMRVALELGFSSSLPEAHSILRDAVESVAHGHRLYANPDLAAVWLEKDEDEASLKAWREEFWHQKEERLFDGLPELHEVWRRYSEWGSHTNMMSVAQRFVVQQTPDTDTWRLNYTGVQPDAFSQMEQVMFRIGEDRLKLDTALGAMRRNFIQNKEAVRLRICALTSVEQQPESNKAATA
jgi:hypothetical protein